MPQIDDLLRDEGRQWRLEVDAHLDPAHSSLRASRPSHRRRAAPPVLAAAVVALLAVTFTILLTHSGDSTDSATRTAPLFRVEIHLDTTHVPAGQPINGQLTAINSTGHPITIDNACNGWFAVGLTDATRTRLPASILVGCANGQLPVGTSTIPFTVSTNETSCNESPEPPTTAADLPVCLGPQRITIPPLPAGTYKTVIYIYNDGIAARPALPKPTLVTVT